MRAKSLFADCLMLRFLTDPEIAIDARGFAASRAYAALLGRI